MAIYTMSAEAADRRARALQKARSIAVSLVIAIVIVDAFLVCVRMGWVYRSWRINEHLFTAVLIGSSAAVLQFLRPKSWKKPAEAALASLQVQSLEMDSEQVRSENGTWSRRLGKNEILRAEEPRKGLGLYLRTSSPFRWLLIPKGIDGYEKIKSDLAASAIPVTKTRLSPHWVETLLFFIVMGSMISELVVRSREALLIDLFVGIVVAVAGLLVAHGKKDNRKLELQYGFFYCFPLIFALICWLGPL